MANEWSYSAGAGFTLDMSLGTPIDIVCLDSRAMTATCEVVLQCALPSDEVKAVLFGAKDGRTRWRFWAEDPATGTDVWAQKVVNGVEEAAVDIGDHGVAAGVPFYLTVRLTGNVVTVRVRAGLADETASSYTLPDTDLDGFNRWGFESQVDNAAVLAATLYQLAPVEASRAEVLVVVCGGLLYVCTDQDGELLRQVPGRVADSVGRVGIAEYLGVAYIVGGGRASKYDPIADTLLEWSDAEHDGALIATVGFSTLPGATEPTAGEPTMGRGTTACTIIEVNNDRICLSGWSERPEVVFESAAGDPLSFRLLNIELGEASAFTINANDSVTCLRALPTNNLLIGCRASVRVQLGDPLWGQVTVPKVADSGISGPNAAVKSDVGLSAYHSPAGLFLVPQDNTLPYSFSDAVLTDAVQIPAQNIGQYTVSMVRDPAKHLLFTFLTPVVSGEATHIVYSERGGRYQPGRGFFFPESFPDATGPTAAILWRGKVLLGTRNGLVLRYDDDPTVGTDCTSLTTTENVESWMFLAMAADAHPVGDTIVTSWRAVLSDDSDPMKMRIYAGATAETLYDFAKNILLFAADIEPFCPPLVEHVRGPAIALYLVNAGETAAYWELEQVVGNFETGRMVTQARALSSGPALTRPGRPPVAVTTPDAAPSEAESGIGSDSSAPGEGYGGDGSPGGGGLKKA